AAPTGAAKPKGSRQAAAKAEKPERRDIVTPPSAATSPLPAASTRTGMNRSDRTPPRTVAQRTRKQKAPEKGRAARHGGGRTYRRCPINRPRSDHPCGAPAALAVLSTRPACTGLGSPA